MPQHCTPFAPQARVGLREAWHTTTIWMQEPLR